MLRTEFNEKELTDLCQMLRLHGTNCQTLVEILKLANDTCPNDAISTYRHVRLLKEFGVLKDEDLLCNVCVYEVVEEHANTCEEYKKRLHDKYLFPCPDEHYNYSKCESAVWMTDYWKIHNITKDKGYIERNTILEETFPDMPRDMLFNHPHFLCEKHIGSMKPYSNKIIGYK